MNICTGLVRAKSVVCNLNDGASASNVAADPLFFTDAKSFKNDHKLFCDWQTFSLTIFNDFQNCPTNEFAQIMKIFNDFQFHLDETQRFLKILIYFL